MEPLSENKSKTSLFVFFNKEGNRLSNTSVLNEQVHTDDGIISFLKSKFQKDNEIKLISSFEKWLNNNIDSSVIVIRKMKLPSNVGGFTTKNNVFLNECFVNSEGLNYIIFTTIHEINHFIDIKNDFDTVSKNMSELNFDVFFKYVLDSEKRTDDNAELTMKQLNIESGFDECLGINKQPIDTDFYVSRYKPFMKQFHDMFHNNRQKYESFSDIQTEIAFG